MKMFTFLFLMLVSFVAMAQEMSDLEAIMGVFSAVKAGGLGAILAAVYKLASSKFLGTWLSKIDPKIHPILVLLLGAALGVVEKASQGQPWYIGLFEGSVIGTVAMGIYDTVKAPAAIVKG
jgi:hypothetical protein